MSRPPVPAAAAPAPPPTSAPMICAPTPPPITPAIVLPTAPKSYCLSAEPAMLPPTPPAISWMIRPTIPPHMSSSFLLVSTTLGGTPNAHPVLKLTELSGAHKSTDNLLQRPYEFCMQWERELDPCALPRMRFASRIIAKSSDSLVALIV